MLQLNPSDAEYEVYSTAVTKVHRLREGELIVFKKRARSTKLAMMMNKDLQDRLQMQYPKEMITWDFPEIEKETVEGFIGMNRTDGALEPKLRLNTAQKVLSEDEGSFI